MPYFQVEGQSIYEKLHQPKFHWLVFSDPQPDVHTLKRQLESLEWVDLTVIPLNQHVAEVFGVNRDFSVLLRPDNYIAFIAPEISPNQVKTYFKELHDEHLSSSD
jgi:hypothetical protein